MESLIITVYNEENTIETLLTSILQQSKLPTEVIIVDAGSMDKTHSLLQSYAEKFKRAGIHYRIFQKKGNRSVGRNYAIEKTTHDIVLVTDAGCILDKHWVRNILRPFVDKKIDVVSGYYHSTHENQTVFQKCLSAYMNVMPDKLDEKKFLPSSRSIAFRKSAWKTVGGYREDLTTAEDLIFARQLKDQGFTFSLAKDAVVYWPQKKSFTEAFRQFFNYARGDGQAFYFRPQTPFLFGRYIAGIISLLVVLLTRNEMIAWTLLLLLGAYIVWAAHKNYRYVDYWKALFILPALQIVSDIAVLTGMSVGFFSSPVMKNAGYQLVGRVLTAALGLAVTALLTRYLSPQMFSEYSFIFSISTLAFLLADLGLDTYLIRTTAQSYSEKAVQTVLTIRFLSMTTIFILLTFVIQLTSYSGDVKTGIIVASLSSMFLLLSNVLWSVFRGRLQYKKMVIAQIITAAIVLVLTGIGVHYKLPLLFFVVSHAFGFLGGFAFSLYCWDRPYSAFKLVSRDIRSLLTTFSPFILGYLFATAYLRIDTVLLGIFHSPQTSSAVGVYSLAYKPFEIAIVLGGYFTSILLPYFSQLGKVMTEHERKKYLSITLFIAFSLSLALCILAPHYVRYIGGDNFYEALLPTQLLSLAAGITIISGYFGSLLLFRNLEKKILHVSMVVLIFNVIANVIFLPTYSYVAASWVTILTQFFVLCGYILVARKYVKNGV